LLFLHLPVFLWTTSGLPNLLDDPVLASKGCYGIQHLVLAIPKKLHIAVTIDQNSPNGAE
jgi:hypothetical protein